MGSTTLGVPPATAPAPVVEATRWCARGCNDCQGENDYKAPSDSACATADLLEIIRGITVSLTREAVHPRGPAEGAQDHGITI